MLPTSSAKRVILMRGLPSCGKSHRAQSLAEAGAGLVLEFDEFFRGPHGFKWQRARLPEARKWHCARLKAALNDECPLIILDDDHRPGPTAKAICALALFAGYSIEFKEPNSPWWRAIRPLLSNPHEHQAELTRWAHKLHFLSSATHRVPLNTFLGRMQNWKPKLTVVDLLAWNQEVAA